MSNVEEFPIRAHENMTVEQAFEVVRKHKPTDVLIIGYDEDGDIFVNSSHMSHYVALFLTERAKKWVFDSIDKKMSD